MAASTALPSLRQLRYLVVLSEKLSFRQAAEALFVTQSTLSSGIKELEATLDVQLFERDPRGVRLTAVGEEITARARDLLARAQDLTDFARRFAEPLTGPLTLGVIPTIAPFLLPRLLPALHKAYPALELYLREDQTEHLLERLRSAQLDAVLMALPWDTGDLDVRPLFRDEFWFVAREDDPATAQQAVAVRGIDLGRLILLEEGHCLRDHAITACGRRATGVAPSVEATSLQTLIQMVDGGLGVTLLPEMTLKAGLLKGTGLVARPFSTNVPSRTVALVTRPTSARGEDFTRLAEFIEQYAREGGRVHSPSRVRGTKRTARN
ncbi:MAG: LysR family transcriptional regulator [Betaproteobacteria bacterium]|nr:LysR family transcriptional regulator [Betaproteobacteria bacterium]